MADTASLQLNRIVQLVAELSRRERAGETSVTLQEMADHLGTRPSVVMRDIRVLTSAWRDADVTWLSSLTAHQDGERISVSSQGPYQRPIRFTTDEILALRVALATEEEVCSEVLRKMVELGDDGKDGRFISPVPFLHGEQAETVDVARAAMNGQRKLAIVYAGEGAEEPVERVIQVHDVVASRGHRYLIAWCELAADWRRFRADRVLEVRPLDGPFVWRDDVPVIDEEHGVFAAPDDMLDDVKVKVSPRIARWIREQHTDADETDDGGVVVTFRTTSVSWLVRTVLQYGDEAEVIEPAPYREAIKRAVGV